jgi:hypothetical protein
MGVILGKALEKITVRPGAGRIVRIGNRKLFGEGLRKPPTPPEGVKVTRDTYIDRRIACGDLVVVTAPPSEPAAAAQPAQPALAAGAAKAPPAPTPPAAASTDITKGA